MYSNHTDSGRDDIRLTSVQVRYSADGEWVTLANSGVTHNHTSTMQKKLFAGFAAPEGYNLAEDVVAVKLVFPAQENSWINFVEAELLGSLEPSSEPEEEIPYVWTVGGYSPGAWTPLVAESNMMAYCWSIQKNGTATSSYDFMTDKSVATVNLWTSTNGVDYSLTDSAIVTETGVDYAFTKTFDAVGLTISYRFETINTSGASSWCSTNEVATFVNYDNAIYYWLPEVAAGSWEDAACWSNSLNDARLAYPSHQYATASFALLDPATPVETTLGASHTVRFAPPASSAATVTLKGGSSVTLQIAGVLGSLKGTNIMDGLVVRYSCYPAFAADARIKLQNGAECHIMPADVNGARAGIELYSGASLYTNLSAPSLWPRFFCNDFEIVLDGGTVRNAGYFTWSGESSPKRGHIVFRSGGGQFLAPSSHRMTLGSGALCELRYEIPGGSWSGYDAAPLRPADVNNDHPFGKVDGNGKFLVNVVFGADSPSRALELPLIRKTDSGTIITNSFDFAAFGAGMEANVPNKKGDYFYWTYGAGNTTEPAAAGDLPTGLSFHYAGRRRGAVYFLR